MAAPVVTENWSDREYVPGQSARRGWVVTGAKDELEAAAAVGSDAYPGAGFILEGTLTADPPIITRQHGPVSFHVVTNYHKPVGDLTTDIKIAYAWEQGNSSESSGVDAGGYPILNTAGWPLASNPQMDVPLHFLVATRVESNFDAQLSVAYRGCINSDKVKIPRVGWVEPGQMRFLSYAPTHDWSFATTKFRNQYRFELNGGDHRLPAIGLFDGFYTRIQNTGYQGWYGQKKTVKGPDGKDKEIVVKQTGRFCNAQGEAVTEPVPLDRSGKPINPEVKVLSSGRKVEEPVEFHRTNPEYIEETPGMVFLRYPRGKMRPFRALGVFRS